MKHKESAPVYEHKVKILGVLESLSDNRLRHARAAIRLLAMGRDAPDAPRFTETENDPHSPRDETFRARIGWLMHGTALTHDEETVRRFAPRFAQR